MTHGWTMTLAALAIAGCAAAPGGPSAPEAPAYRVQGSGCAPAATPTPTRSVDPGAEG